MLINNQIIKRFKEGDAESFDIIYNKYSKKLFHFVLGLVKDRVISEDLVQEVFVSLWENRSQVNPKLNFENYIFTIAYNSIRKFFRDQSTKTKVIDLLIKDSPELVDSIYGTVIYNEMLDQANKIIETLPQRRKVVYKLSRQEGMKTKEIADKLNISTRTVENHLAKALKYLRTELSDISLPILLFFHLFIK